VRLPVVVDPPITPSDASIEGVGLDDDPDYDSDSIDGTYNFTDQNGDYQGYS
jgi:hypothetical protein